MKPRVILVVALIAAMIAGLGELLAERNSVPAGSVFRDCDTCPEMVVVSAGRFTMGASASEQMTAASPPHPVAIERAFAVGKFEVTFDQWEVCVRQHGCSHMPDDRGWGRGARPIIHVSWNDAMQYVDWLTRKTGKRYRLLTEAEWEYVARAGATTAYAFGDHIWPAQANYYTRATAPVGSYAPNAFGVHDMHGNVWEWTTDCWNESYNGAPATGEAWLAGDCSRHVFRGGSWDDYPWFLRSAERSNGTAGIRLNDLGFRVARAQ
jgi:formylglycine-generating enzyme required for sulfatase activity